MPTAPEIAPVAAWANALLQPLGVAVGLHREAGELEAERGRLGVDAVGAADAQRVRVLARPLGEHGGQLAGGRDDHLAGAPQLQGQRRVEHVRRGEAEVDPATGRARGAADRTSTKAATSWSVTASRSLTASTVKVAPRIASRSSSVGPSSASAAATSTSRQAVIRASSVQMAPSSGRV